MSDHYNMDDILVALSQKYEGNFMNLYKAILNKEKLSDNEIEHYINLVDEKYITVCSENYPSSFKQDLKCPPICMYYQGNLELLENEFHELENPFDKNKRFFFSVSPCQDGMDYVIGCENQNDISRILDYFIENHPEINFVNYKQKESETLCI